MNTQAEEIWRDQQVFFDDHPFPGLDLSEIETEREFIYLLEKNELYRSIAQLLGPQDRVLDAGCGTGEFTTYLGLKSKGEILGIDYSRPTVDWATNVGNRFANSNVYFREEDVFQLSSAKIGTFDFVLAMGLFPSIPDELSGMRKLVEVLRPGGIAIFGFFDPLARIPLRVKRWALRTITKKYDGQERICQGHLLGHLEVKNERTWYVNQLTEEFLNFHSPIKAQKMMNSCGLKVVDSFPRCNTLTGIIPESIQTEKEYRIPRLQFPFQLKWLFNETWGYFVLIGKKERQE